MEEKINAATTQRSQENHVIDASLVRVDIPAYIEKITNEVAWKENDRNAITVFKTNGLCIVLIAMHKAAEMPTHKADGLISLQVLEGTITFTTNEQSIELSMGQMLALHESIPHSVVANEDAVFLLTVTTSKKQFTD